MSETLKTLYGQHVEERRATTARALAETGYDRLLVGSGRPFTYFADDNDAPFHPTPHFAHWTPLDGPGHVLEVVPDRRPRVVRVVPRDYWYEPPSPAPEFVRELFDVIDVDSPEAAWKEISPNGRTAFLGGNGEDAKAAGLSPEDVNPKPLVARLDWERSYKSEYELRSMAEASSRAAAGHIAAREAFRGGASEIEAHHAYLTAIGGMEEGLPYPTIIGLDERASTLHYHGKRGQQASPGHVMLIDAGATVRGYGSDITRTYARETAHPIFLRLLAGVDALQRRLAADARPGLPYLDLHLKAHRYIAELLVECAILRVPADQAYERGLTRPFFPHGLGHFLGIQVHDVAGKQADREGTPAPPPETHPYLRTTRVIEERQLFTIEPGLYFIPMLLEPYRTGADAGAFDWELVDALTPFGGIRVEDDVYVGAGANRNLTREVLPD